MAFRHVSDQKYKCPICGKENTPHETFRCRRCARQYICDDHLDNKERVCEQCATKKDKKEGLDDAGMVIVHEGEFFMGQDDDENAIDAQPLHALRLERILVDQFPVSNKDFKEFKPDHEYPEGEDDKPATNVTWNEANDYAMSKGKRLMSEPEWEKSARSRDKREYPWGKDLPEEIIEKAGGDILEGLKKYNISPYNVRDMVGGPWEWTSSRYELYPKGPTAVHGYYEGNMAIRGGELSTNEPAKTYHRSYAHPSERRPDITFRCCKGAKQEYESKYAGADIKRPSKSSKENEPPPEFKAFPTHKKKQSEDPIQDVDFSGMTVKEAVRKAKELAGETDSLPEPRKTLTSPPDEPLGASVPGKLGSDKRTKPMSDVATVTQDDWTPAADKPNIPWGIIIIVIIVAVAAIVAFTMMGGGERADTSDGSAYETPPQTSLVSAPGFKQVDRKSFSISQGNRMYSTNMVIQKGDRVTIKIDGWTDSSPPPLVAKFEDGPEIEIGTEKTFISPQIGRIMLGYMDASIILPEGKEQFTVQVIVEMPDN